MTELPLLMLLSLCAHTPCITCVVNTSPLVAYVRTDADAPCCGSVYKIDEQRFGLVAQTPDNFVRFCNGRAP